LRQVPLSSGRFMPSTDRAIICCHPGPYEAVLLQTRSTRLPPGADSTVGAGIWASGFLDALPAITIALIVWRFVRSRQVS